MATGLSIHIGLNSVDPGHYQGWSGPLNACELDAKDMGLLAKSQRFQPTVLLTKQATRAAVEAELSKAAASLKMGDICLLTYSGHGGQTPDLNHDETDALDETWCLYDGQLIDDELYALLGRFAKGVRVLVLADSCHSGTSIKNAQILASYTNAQPQYVLNVNVRDTGVAVLPTPSYRAMPLDVATRVYLANQQFYDPILSDTSLKNAGDNVQASCLLISGCQDDQLSIDGPFNGVFTGTLKSVWNGGKFKGDHQDFWKAIKSRMAASQQPNLYPVGLDIQSFQKQTPFTI